IWRNRIPCAQLQEVNDFPQFPSTRNTGELQHCTTLPATVLNQESLAVLRTIPNLQSYTATFNKFKNTNNNLGLWINIGWMTSTILEAIMGDFEVRYGFYNSNTNLFYFA
ncbi:hypothetical protein KI688_008880, partial [Linnemannia hyalina]